jgi:hypothetical protein
VLVIKSNFAVLESMGTLGDIYVQIIGSILDLIPEIKSGCTVLSDEFLSIDEIPDNGLDSEFFYELSPQALGPSLSRFESSSWQTIKSTSTIPRSSFTQIYFSSMDYDSTNLGRDKKFSIFHMNHN